MCEENVFYSCCLLHVAFCFLCVEKQGVLLVLRRGFKLPSQVLSCQVPLKPPCDAPPSQGGLRRGLKRSPFSSPPSSPLEEPPSSPIEKPPLLKPLQAPLQPFNLLPSPPPPRGAGGFSSPLREAPPSQAPLRRTMMEHAPRAHTCFAQLRDDSCHTLHYAAVAKLLQVNLVFPCCVCTVVRPGGACGARQQSGFGALDISQQGQECCPHCLVYREFGFSEQ